METVWRILETIDAWIMSEPTHVEVL